jgi:hypothetical protein
MNPIKRAGPAFRWGSHRRSQFEILLGPHLLRRNISHKKQQKETFYDNTPRILQLPLTHHEDFCRQTHQDDEHPRLVQSLDGQLQLNQILNGSSRRITRILLRHTRLLLICRHPTRCRIQGRLHRIGEKLRACIRHDPATLTKFFARRIRTSSDLVLAVSWKAWTIYALRIL